MLSICFTSELYPHSSVDNFKGKIHSDIYTNLSILCTVKQKFCASIKMRKKSEQEYDISPFGNTDVLGLTKTSRGKS
jgi:hypothetical protein